MNTSQQRSHMAHFSKRSRYEQQQIAHTDRGKQQELGGEISHHGVDEPFKIYIHDLNSALTDFMESSSSDTGCCPELTDIEGSDLAVYEYNEPRIFGLGHCTV
jgi:hypothetical protein